MATISSGGASLAFGGSALLLDIVSGDGYGATIGGGSMIYSRLIPLDLSYGVCRTNETCSNFLDNTLP